MQPEPDQVAGDDADLLRRAAAGDPSAAKTMLDEHLPIVYGYVYARVAGSEAVAQDVMQETVLEGLKSSASFKGESRLSTWLCTIARRRIFRYYEQERKQQAAAQGLHLVVEEDEIEVALDKDRIIRLLAQLSAVHRQVLILKYLDDLSVQDIAGQLGRSNVQVQSLLQRARAAFKTLLEASDG